MKMKPFSDSMWTPVTLTDKATGRSIHITIFEREMFLAGECSFDDLWQMQQPFEGQEVIDISWAVVMS